MFLIDACIMLFCGNTSLTVHYRKTRATLDDRFSKYLSRISIVIVPIVR